MTAFTTRTIQARVRDNPLRGIGTTSCTCGCQDRLAKDTIVGGFLVKTVDGVPVLRADGRVETLDGPVLIRGGRPVVISSKDPTYLRSQAIAAAADAQREHGAAINAANQALWNRGRK